VTPEPAPDLPRRDWKKWALLALLLLMVLHSFPILREIVPLSFFATPNETPPPAPTTGFIGQQITHARVKAAWNDKANIVRRNLRQHTLSENNLNILVSVYKDEKRLEIHAKSGSSAAQFRKVAEYEIYQLSGQPGPKHQQGDRQTPEGFYHIDRFNPASRYYLSLGV
jgi:hypothetical protein